MPTKEPSHFRAGSVSKRILITATWCSACSTAKRTLKRKNIPFREVDVESTEGKKLDKKFNFKSVPSMLINGKEVDDVEDWFD